MSVVTTEAIKPMQFTEADISEVEDLIADDGWIFEQKFDGTRLLARVSQSGIGWYGAGGARMGHTAVLQHLPVIEPQLKRLLSGYDGELVLDGELLIHTGEYLVFDLAWAVLGDQPLVGPLDEFEVRRAGLDALFRGGRDAPLMDLGPVKLVEQAASRGDKHRLWDLANEQGIEGVMAKRLDGRYEPGRRVTHVVKLKFTKTADVVVLARDVGGKNAHLGVYRDGELIQVGGCSMIGKPDAQVGDVIEVKYLYWTGAALYQPRMIRIRDDKPAWECTPAQFPLYSRAVI